jgi:hypothetical protein
MKLLVVVALALIGTASARAQSLVDISAAASMSSGLDSAAVSGANLPQIRGNITRSLQQSMSASAGSWKAAGEGSLSSLGTSSMGSWQRGGHASGGASELKGWATARSGGGTANGWVTNDGRR